MPRCGQLPVLAIAYTGLGVPLMPNDVLMPQMGESIAEGTVVRWMKKVGDHVDRDEPLFEISTDKVDAEIPSPSGGVLLQIRAQVGETVPVDSVVAVIGERGEIVENSSSQAEEGSDGGLVPGGESVGSSAGRLSPAVRRLVTQHDVDLSAVVGTGNAGRVTKSDVLAYVEAQTNPPRSMRETSPAVELVDGDSVEPLSVMRQRIAEQMVESRRRAAHAHTVFEVDFSRIASLRAERSKSEPPPAYLAYIVKAVTDALIDIPMINASVDGDRVIYHDRVNVGIAVALDWGLIVPVVQQADQLNIDELDVAIKDLASRARSKQLSPEDVKGGTFTLTNPGGFGSVLGMPIIKQPQVAILCVGAIENRPVVVEDKVVVRLRAFLTLGFDHRLIDGAIADQFLLKIKTSLEENSDASGDA